VFEGAENGTHLPPKNGTSTPPINGNRRKNKGKLHIGMNEPTDR
jgi:hypothetical protein